MIPTPEIIRLVVIGLVGIGLAIWQGWTFHRS